MPELRQNFFTKEWVIIATERAKRPKELARQQMPKKLAALVESCPFCPGNEKMTPPEIYAIRSPGAATNVKKPQFALITSSKSFIELRQCLASNGVGRTVQKHLDLGVVSFSGIVGHPAARLKMKILQIVGGPLSTRFRAQDFVVCAALAASMDVWKIFEEEPRAMDQC